MTDPKSAVVSEFFQRLEDNELLEDILMTPAYARELFTSNFFQRCFSHLFATSSEGATALACSAAGYLKVQQAAAGIDSEEAFTHTTIDAEEEETFAQVVSQVDIQVTAGDAKIQFSSDGATYGEFYYINNSGFLSVDRAVKSYKINKWNSTLTAIVHGLW